MAKSVLADPYTCPLRVGDTVKGRYSGRRGTVLAVVNGGEFYRVNLVGYPEDMSRDYLTFVSRKAEPVFKPGQKVRPKEASGWRKDLTWTVKAYDPETGELWACSSSDTTGNCTVREDEFEPVPDFFEAGKKYTYSNGTFDCRYIEKDGDGKPVAIGVTEWGGAGAYWDTRRAYGQWREA